VSRRLQAQPEADQERDSGECVHAIGTYVLEVRPEPGSAYRPLDDQNLIGGVMYPSASRIWPKSAGLPMRLASTHPLHTRPPPTVHRPAFSTGW